MACSLDVTRTEPIPWDGQLTPTGAEPELTGSVAAISRERSTDASIDVSGGEVGDRWLWRFRRGTCDEPGEVIGAPGTYPILEAAEQSDPELPGSVVGATADAVLPTTLSPDGDYHAIVAPEEEPDAPLACGLITPI